MADSVISIDLRAPFRTSRYGGVPVTVPVWKSGSGIDPDVKMVQKRQYRLKNKLPF